MDYLYSTLKQCYQDEANLIDLHTNIYYKIIDKNNFWLTYCNLVGKNYLSLAEVNIRYAPIIVDIIMYRDEINDNIILSYIREIQQFIKRKFITNSNPKAFICCMLLGATEELIRIKLIFPFTTIDIKNKCYPKFKIDLTNILNNLEIKLKITSNTKVISDDPIILNGSFDKNIQILIHSYKALITTDFSENLIDVNIELKDFFNISDTTIMNVILNNVHEDWFPTILLSPTTLNITKRFAYIDESLYPDVTENKYLNINIPDDFMCELVSLYDIEKKILNILLSGTSEDIGKLFVDIRKSDIRYFNTRRDEFYVWVESMKLWKKETSTYLCKLVRDTCIPLVQDFTNKFKFDDQSKETKIIKLEQLVKKLKDPSFNRSIVEIIKVEDEVNDHTFESKLDQLLDFFPIADGKMIDLRNSVVRARTREDYCTMETPYIYDENINTTSVREFILEFANSRLDYEKFLQLLLGYFLTGRVSMKKFFMVIGIRDNGKSKFVDMIGKLLREYYYPLNVPIITGKTNAGSPTPELANLLGKRFAGVSEFPKGLKLNESIIKAITGGDEMNARLLHRNPQIIPATAKLMIAGNYLPINDPTPAMITRWCILPFDSQYTSNPRINQGEYKSDPSIDNKIKNPKFLNELFNYAVVGAKRFYEQTHNGGIVYPKCVILATKFYFGSKDPLKRWLKQCTIRDETSKRVDPKILYDDYLSFIGLTNDEPLKKADFIKSVNFLGYAYYKSNRMCFKGIRLKNYKEDDNHRMIDIIDKEELFDPDVFYYLDDDDEVD